MARSYAPPYCATSHGLMSSSATLACVTSSSGSPCTPAGTWAPAAASAVGSTSISCTGRSVRRREPWLVRLHVVEEEEDRAAGGRAVEPRERRGVDLVRAAEGLEAEARGELLREVDHVRADVEEEARGVVVVPEALRHAEAAVEVG